MEYILFGAGGHAKVVLDILRANGQNVAGVMDDDLKESYWRGIAVLGSMQTLKADPDSFRHARFIVTIGNNEIRRKVAEQIERLGMQFGNAHHPSAILGTGCMVGEGCVVMPGAIINADSRIGKHVIINTASSVDHDCLIHDYAHISPGAHLAGGVVVGKEAQIGIGASVIPKVNIGEGAIVGAGSVVIHNIPPHVVTIGVPARSKEE
jgi:acetyltransferase EpsM